MKARYGTYTEDRGGIFGTTCGVLSESGKEYETVDIKTAETLAKLLNEPSDCQFNCRARREADYLQGWVDRDRDCPITESGKRCAKRYVAGAKSGLEYPAMKG